MLTRCKRAHSPRGFTLTELMVAISLLGLVGTTLMGVIIRQQRFYLGASEILDTRSSIRHAVDIVPSDLRGLAPSQGDIYGIGLTWVEFRASLGAGVVCTIDAGNRARITLPPTVTASQNGLTAWVTRPEQSDSLYVYDPGVRPDTSDDVWRVYELTVNPTTGVCPTATGFTATADEANRGVALVLSAPLPATVPVGASIRFFRRARYQLYASGTDGQWYLGYRDCLSTRSTPCSALQPVSGPYLPWAAGLTFLYYDNAGALTATPANVARIDITTRARTSGPVRIDGWRTGVFYDSLTASVDLRNR